MSTKKPTAKPAQTQARLCTFTDLVIRHTRPEGLKALRELMLRCPLPDAAKIAEKLQAGIHSKICGTRADLGC